MALPSDFPLFSGDDDTAEKPGTWLKRLERTWTPTTTDATKIHDFSLSLDADSVAELWWDNLDAADKANWTTVKAAFRKEWPPARILDVSATTRRDILMSMKLTDEDVGKMEGEGRKKDYTHAIWADKAEPLWKQLEDKNGLLIPEVRANLPQGIIDCLPEKTGMHKDYAIFLQAVREVPVERAIRRTEELKRLAELEEQVTLLSQPSWTPPSPISRLTQKLATTSLNNPSYPHYTTRATQNPTTTAPNPTVNTQTPYVHPHR
jgi:hypothetical protein